MKGTSLIDQKKAWLLGVTWDSVVALNRSLCQAQKLDPLNNPKSYSSAEAWWSRAAQSQMTLIQAFDACRRACDMSAFTFNNGNTFAAIGRSLIEDSLRAAPPLERQIMQTTIGHYIAGKVDRKELQQILVHLAPVVSTPAEPARTPAPDLQPQALAEARPVA